jgi:4-hydroxy-3-methylbut-2-enyl diphosphate reductase
MKVVLAEVMGMCFGVRDALKRLESISQPQQVTIHGELVHNEVVLTQLGARGFHMVSETRREGIPQTPTVLVTAHGISDRERRRLQSAGKELVDTTCPLVTRVHRAAQALQTEGYHVLVIGRPGHVEVEGIVQDLDSYDVIPGPEAVRHYPQRRLGIVCQTTAVARNVQKVRESIGTHNPEAEIRFVDTVCHPTRDHQQALHRLLEQVQAVVVVGGRNSNNTRELVALCGEKKVPAFHVQGAADLRADWFTGFDTIGLTAGTSTLDATIAEVHQALLRLPAGVAR